MRKTNLIALALALSLSLCSAIALVSGRTRTASADSGVDCSGLKALNFDHRYKKGDRIWSSYGYTGPGHPLECKLDECWQKNATDHSAWESKGDCKARPPGL